MPVWPLIIFATSATLITLTTLEFGGASLRGTACRAVYPKTPLSTTNADYFPSVNASTLIASILAMRDGREVPTPISSSKIIHQSWKNRDPPSSYRPLMDSWRSTYPDWAHVLWSNEDNLALVETFYPEWRSAYDALPSDIYRAQFARNLYM